MKRLPAVVLVLVLALLALVAWLHDFITFTGARTIYTAGCADGQWRGAHCTGHLVAGDRHRFKILKGHGEVLYWIATSTQPSNKLTRCTIADAKDWICRDAGAAGAAAPVRGMKFGRPVVAPEASATFHAVPKWKWLLLAQGVRVFEDADT